MSSGNWKGLFTSGAYASSSSPACKRKSARLAVELLEDRTVPAMMDLSTAHAAVAISGAIFEQASLSPAGTGYLRSFLRLQAHGHNTVEQGYNTDARPLEFDEKTNHRFTRAIHLSEMKTVTINGTTYHAILLDINQSHASPFLSLDELRIYVSNSATLTGFDATTFELGGQTPVFDLGSNWIKLNGNLSHGSGSTDMVLFLPDSLFATWTPTMDPYVYLYSKFGVNFAANAGFEEWAPGRGRIPLPATLGGFVYQDNNTNQSFDGGDVGVAGIILTLTGMNNQNQQVTMTATTAADGSYFFVGFLPGTYTITESAPPAQYTEEVSNIGTVNGMPDGNNPTVDTLTNIGLLAGQSGINYNFGLTLT